MISTPAMDIFAQLIMLNIWRSYTHEGWCLMEKICPRCNLPLKKGAVEKDTVTQKTIRTWWKCPICGACGWEHIDKDNDERELAPV